MANPKPINHFGEELCKLLGIESASRIVIDASVNAVTTITFTTHFKSEDNKKLMDLIKKYEISESKD